MKKIAILTAFAFALTGFNANAAETQAQNVKTNSGFYFGLGINHITKTDAKFNLLDIDLGSGEYSSNTGFDLMFGYKLKNNFAFEFNYLINDDLDRFGVNAYKFFNIGYETVNPYVKAGLGQAGFDGYDNEFYFSLGAGISYSAYEGLEVFAGIDFVGYGDLTSKDYLYNSTTGEPIGNLTVDLDTSIEFKLGTKYHF